MKREFARILIVAAVVGVVAIIQNVILNRREAILKQVPKGAIEAQVIEVLGQTASKGADGEAWY